MAKKSIGTLAAKATLNTGEFTAGTSRMAKAVDTTAVKIKGANKDVADAQVNFENRVEKAISNRVRAMDAAAQRDKVRRAVNMRMFGSEESADKPAAGMLARLAQQNEKIGKVMNLIRGGTAVAAVTMATAAVVRYTDKLIEMQTKLAAGAISVKEMNRELLLSIPIVGDIARGFDNLEDWMTGRSVKQAIAGRIEGNIAAGRDALATATENVSGYSASLRNKTSEEDRNRQRATLRDTVPEAGRGIFDNATTTEDRIRAAKAEGDAAKTALRDKLKIVEAEREVKKIEAQLRDLNANNDKGQNYDNIVALAPVQAAAAKRLADAKLAQGGGLAAIENATQERINAIQAQGVADRNTLARKEATGALTAAKSLGQRMLDFAKGLGKNGQQRRVKDAEEAAKKLAEDMKDAKEEAQRIDEEAADSRAASLEASAAREPDGLAAIEAGSAEAAMARFKQMPGMQTSAKDKATADNTRMIEQHNRLLEENNRRLLGVNVGLPEFAMG
jgi:hypothetical protein